MAALFAWTTETATDQAEAQSGQVRVNPTPLHLGALHPRLIYANPTELTPRDLPQTDLSGSGG